MKIVLTVMLTIQIRRAIAKRCGNTCRPRSGCSNEDGINSLGKISADGR